MLKKNCRKLESRLLFSYETTITVGTNLRPIKAMRRDERFLSLAFNCILHRGFNWPKYTCIHAYTVVIGKPERQVRKDSHCDSKQQ